MLCATDYVTHTERKISRNRRDGTVRVRCVTVRRHGLPLAHKVPVARKKEGGGRVVTPLLEQNSRPPSREGERRSNSHPVWVLLEEEQSSRPPQIIPIAHRGEKKEKKKGLFLFRESQVVIKS